LYFAPTVKSGAEESRGSLPPVAQRVNCKGNEPARPWPSLRHKSRSSKRCLSGGINLDAVQWKMHLWGGFWQIVWFRTFDADNHVKRFKGPGEDDGS
jgi:hypothetical protein